MFESKLLQDPADVWVELTTHRGEKEKVRIQFPTDALKLPPLMATFRYGRGERGCDRGGVSEWFRT